MAYEDSTRKGHCDAVRHFIGIHSLLLLQRTCMTSGRCSINLDTSIIVNKVEFNDFITIIRKEKALKWPPTYSYIPCRVIICTQIKRSFIESILVASGLGSWSRIRLWDGRRKGIWGNRENIGVFMKIRRNQTFTAA